MFLRLKAQSCEAKTAAGLICYSLSRSPARKTLTIYVKEDRAVHVRAPLFLNNREIIRFVERKAHWIVKSQKKLEARFSQIQRHSYRDGEQFLFLGHKYPLLYVPSQRKRIKMDFKNARFEAFVPLEMPCDQIEGNIQKALVSWYQTQAKRIVRERVPFWAQKLNVHIKKLTVRTQKRIWGSCYYKKGSVNINWKIVMAPLEVLDYIIVHELCHFFAPNHSRRFWDKVRSTFPDYGRSEAWLKEHEVLTRLS